MRLRTRVNSVRPTSVQESEERFGGVSPTQVGAYSLTEKGSFQRLPVTRDQRLARSVVCRCSCGENRSWRGAGFRLRVWWPSGNQGPMALWSQRAAIRIGFGFISRRLLGRRLPSGYLHVAEYSFALPNKCQSGVAPWPVVRHKLLDPVL